MATKMCPIPPKMALVPFAATKKNQNRQNPPHFATRLPCNPHIFIPSFASICTLTHTMSTNKGRKLFVPQANPIIRSIYGIWLRRRKLIGNIACASSSSPTSSSSSTLSQNCPQICVFATLQSNRAHKFSGLVRLFQILRLFLPFSRLCRCCSQAPILFPILLIVISHSLIRVWHSSSPLKVLLWKRRRRKSIFRFFF